MAPEDLNRWYVRGKSGTMAPFSSFAQAIWTLGPASLTRYNGFCRQFHARSEEQGRPKPGVF